MNLFMKVLKFCIKYSLTNKQKLKKDLVQYTSPLAFSIEYFLKHKHQWIRYCVPDVQILVWYKRKCEYPHCRIKEY